AVADFERVGLVGDVAAPRQDPGLDAADVARSDDLHAVRLAGFPDQVPQLDAVLAGLVQVDLVTQFRGVPGPGDHDLHAFDLLVDRVVVRHFPDRVAEQVDHHVQRFRPLDLHRAHVSFADLHVHAQAVGQSLGPQQDVAVR